MSMHKAIQEHLAGKSEITALCSTRIFQDDAPDKNSDGTTPLTKPYITYSQKGNSHTHHLGGDSGLANPMFQIDCWDDNRSGARELFEAVREEMDTFTGTMGTDGDATTVRSVSLENDLDTFLPGEGSEDGLYGVSSTWEFWINETAATP